jgi:hypothetical protein
VHPVAVYGVAYLTQRTILFATFFSLLSVWFYCRTFDEKRVTYIFPAALFYCLAVFAKEHAVMLPLAIAPFAMIYTGDFRYKLKIITLYWLLCLPASIMVILAVKGVVASSYEPSVAPMLLALGNTSTMINDHGAWISSAVLQANFFSDYIYFWFIPDIRNISVDLRFDFVHIWSSWWLLPKLSLFILLPIYAAYCLTKKGPLVFLACGFLYSWFLFFTEMVSVRFQEPFVLYRSYLWAFGYVVMLAAILIKIPRRTLIIIALPLCITLFILAQNRLSSFANDATLWKDAAKKLSSNTLIGSDRIFYNRGNAYLQEKKYLEAISDYSYAILQNQKFSEAYYNRSLAYASLKLYDESLNDLNSTLKINDHHASAFYAKGFVLEKKGCIDEAYKAYDKSSSLGNWMAKLKMRDLTVLSESNKLHECVNDIGSL